MNTFIATNVTGGQGNTIHGDYHYDDRRCQSDEGPAPLRDQLEQLRQALKAAREAGQIDETTTSEVHKELEVAGDLVDEEADEGRNRFLLAMRKCKGMVESVSTLTTMVSQIITAAQGVGG